MRSKSQTNGQSFIEAARRRQIVDTAIQIIATQGLSQASLSQIASQAGISKGVISYHFEGKEELIEEILSHLIREPAEFIKRRVDAAGSALDKLRAYIEANFEFMRTHRNHYVALVDLWGSRGWYEGRNRFNAEAYEPSRKYLSKILVNGEQSGEFRDLPLPTMASVLQGAIDGVMLQWVCDPDAIDLNESAEEILNMLRKHIAAGQDDAEMPSSRRKPA